LFVDDLRLTEIYSIYEAVCGDFEKEGKDKPPESELFVPRRVEMHAVNFGALKIV
jgi:hypothetical protein